LHFRLRPGVGFRLGLGLRFGLWLSFWLGLDLRFWLWLSFWLGVGDRLGLGERLGLCRCLRLRLGDRLGLDLWLHRCLRLGPVRLEIGRRGTRRILSRSSAGGLLLRPQPAARGRASTARDAF
jgi:hypothetical protein